MHKYMKVKHGNLEHKSVSKEEFINLLIESGLTKEKAEFQVSTSEIFQSEVLIGDILYSIGS